MYYTNCNDVSQAIAKNEFVIWPLSGTWGQKHGPDGRVRYFYRFKNLQSELITPVLPQAA